MWSKSLDVFEKRAAMEWSESIIRRVHEGSIAGESWPYAGGSAEDIEDYLKDTAAYLRRSELLTVETHFDSFGCGYASFVEVFCSKKEGSCARQYGDSLHTDGLLVYLCRHAPMAAYGRETRTRSSNEGKLRLSGACNYRVSASG